MTELQSKIVDIAFHPQRNFLVALLEDGSLYATKDDVTAGQNTSVQWNPIFTPRGGVDNQRSGVNRVA